MTDTTFPQCRIVPERLLYPETVERLLNKIYSIPGIRRMILNGPRLPAVIPAGPAKGIDNPHGSRQVIKVGDQDFELQVQVGSILLELANRDVIPALKTACDEVFTTFSDYAKYGPEADRDMLGLTDPSSKVRPIILQGNK